MHPTVRHAVPVSVATLVGVATLVAVLLVSCGSDKGTLPLTGSSPSPAASSTRSPSASPSPAADGIPTAGLTVGESATVPFESDGRTVSIRVVTRSITKGSIADLADYQLTAAQKASTPYYVRASFTNLGAATLSRPGLSQHLLAFTADGSRASPLTAPGFTRCDDSEPYPWGPGGQLTECAAYLVPAKAVVTTVTFQFNDRQNAIVWKAG